MKHSLTNEQQKVVDHLLNNDGILLVDALAGTGKSTLAKRVTQELSVSSGIYTAFNKAIVEEMVSKFAHSTVEAKTLHALAYSFVRPKNGIGTFSYKCISEKLTYTDKRSIIDALDTFFVSSSPCMYDYFEKYFKGSTRAEYKMELAAKYVEEMANDELQPTFNFLLKSLHLMLLEGTVKIKVDIVILDECQDSTGVALEIFKLIDAPKKLGLGDANQAIYSFLNLVNGFEVLKDVSEYTQLTHSFRCSTQIARRIETKMKKVLDKDFSFTGTESPCRNGKTLFVTLTNAAIIGELSERLEEGKSFTLLRKPQDIFAAVLAVSSASQGKAPYQSKFAFLMDLYEEFHQQSVHKTYTAYLLMELDDPEINGAIALLSNLRSKSINIFNLYTEVKNAKPDPDYVVSTAYTSKGLEMETVYICADLNSRFEKACNGELSDEEALTIKRVYYVACSRAGVNLENSIL